MTESRKAFEAAGLRFTRQRGAVYEALRSVTTHPTADALIDLVREYEPGISLATVYNSLEAMTDAGLCRRLPGAGGACRFDADMSDHLHAVLPDGRVIDVHSPEGAALLEAVTPALIAEIERGAGESLAGFSVQLVARRSPV